MESKDTKLQVHLVKDYEIKGAPNDRKRDLDR